MKIKLIIADDHEIYRDGLQLALESNERYQVMDSCKDGEHLIRSVSAFQPDIVLTDLQMPLMNGVQAIEIIARDYPNVMCMALSNFDSEYMIIEAMNAGAVGYIQKTSRKAELFEAIEQVNRGEEFYCRSTSAQLMHLAMKNIHPRNKEKQGLFSDEEKEIIKLICEDMGVQAIADKLFMGYRKVENARGRIFEKMNVTTVAGIAVYAVRHGIYFVDKI